MILTQTAPIIVVNKQDYSTTTPPLPFFLPPSITKNNEV